MGTSHYFNNYSGASTNEQRMYEDVIEESIKIMGHNCYYLPRDSYDSLDQILGERPESVFAKAYIIEMYIANTEGYEGQGDFFSKFGLEIRDTSNFIVSRRAFQRWIPSFGRDSTPNAHRPREGDLIYVPVMQKIYEIKFVEEELMFFSLGNPNPYIYELRAEVLRYSQENITTGVDEIDSVDKTVVYTIEFNMKNGNSNNYTQGETIYQGANLASSTASAEVKEWMPDTKILSAMNIKGIFANNTVIIGATSNAQYTVASTDTLGDFSEEDIFDNKVLQSEADVFIDFTEINPFGKP